MFRRKYRMLQSGRRADLNAGHCRRPALAGEWPISICRCVNAQIRWAWRRQHLQAVRTLEWIRAAPDDCRSPAPRQVAARSRSLEAMLAPLTAPVRGPPPAQWSASLRALRVECPELPRPPEVELNQHR